ncbi:hypothetical protein K474DRAFT_1661006 [Panus rudis PR-1116 ss-1]|nr:hypothetical protein K474DRAFT_1661006 [Panus rudis PR-1116 ss-1]
MILLGILIQVALHFSIKNDGYPVPPPSPALSWLSTSFLTGFFPTLLIAPIAYMWHVTDWALRWFQPYVSMAKGDAKAEDSVLLDYIAMNKLFGIWHSYRRKHWLVFVTMVIGFTTNLFQPLAGAVLSVKPIPRPQNITVKSTTTIGLSPDVNDLNAFFAAAGFSEAAAFQGLPDPPFVHEGWAAAQIEPPKSPGLNASLQWNTTGLQTQANCATANSLNFTLISTDSASIQASMPNGCTGSVTFNPLSADQQYGSSPADPTTCGIDKNTPQQFLPVFFWFYHMRDDVKQPQARGVICQPTIKVFNAQVFLDLSNSNITNVTLIDEYTTANNVTGGDLQGRAFNAVLLDSLAGNNSFIQARATSVRAGIPGAAFRLASQDPRGLDAEFDDETAFFRMINKIYTQHLSVSAKSIYFVPNTGEELSAIKTSLTDRLIVE